MAILTESNFANVEILHEGEGKEKSWFIEGTFMQADVVNKNRRIYPMSVMESQINSYIKDYVEPRRAVGELSHPDSATINLDKITHIIESIRKEGSNFIGKARVLNTPSGNIVKGLLEGGVQLGVSSRGTGSLKRNSQGINEVQDDFRLSAVDIVYQPSAPDAFVSGLMEGQMDNISESTEDMKFIEALTEELKQKRAWEDQNRKVAALESFLKRISR